MLFHLIATALLGFAAALPADHVDRRQSSPNPPLSTSIAKALYFMTNSPSGNVVRAVAVDSNGQIISGSSKSYATGGNGARMVVNAKTPANAGTNDALGSQGSVTVAGNKLYVVNAGSGTLTLFNISCTDPTSLQMLGKPLSTLGDFPTTVTANSVIDTACVANTGNRSGIACFGLDYNGLIALDKTQRPVSLPGGVQSNPPSGPASTISQVLFNANQSELLVIVKGDSSGNGGYLASYPVAHSGQVSRSSVSSNPNQSHTMIGTVSMTPIRLAVIDAITGGLLLVDTAGSYGTSSSVSGNNVYYRWLALSPVNNLLYATSGSANLYASVNSNSGAVVTHATGFPVGNLGETVAANNFLYTLSYGDSNNGQYILVTQTNSDGTLTDIQSFGITGVDNNIAGLAAFIPGEVDSQCSPEVPVSPAHSP